MRAYLYVLWIATIGADRLDLLAGAGPVVLKPFLMLSPIIIALELADAVRRDRALPMSPDAGWLFVVQSALLCVLLVSVAWSFDTTLALGRLALIVTEAYLCVAAAMLLVSRPDARGILRRGAVLGIVLMLVMDVVQVVRWLELPWFNFLTLGGVLELTPATYGPWLPRPSGVSVDANRGGFLLLLYMYLLWLLAPPSGRRSILVALAWFALLLTLSRSAVLAAIIVSAGWQIRRGFRLTRAAVGVTALVVTCFVGLLLFSGTAREAMLALGEVLAGRVSIREGSSSDHLTLLVRGWEIATSDLRTLLFGIGYGNSYLVLQDFFAGTKYANFHSMYVTLLVEAGVAALVPALALLLYPLLRAGAFWPLVAGLMAFNIFYQAHSEAMFWLVVALAWLYPAAGEDRSIMRPASALNIEDPQQHLTPAGTGALA